MERRLISVNEPVSITWVQNILDPVESRKTLPFAPGKTIGDALLQFVPLAPQDFEVTAYLNGDIMPAARHDVILLPGDNLVMCARPQGGGGGGGSNPLAMVAMLAVMVVASIVTFGVGALVATGAWAWGMGMYASGGVLSMIAGGIAGAAVTALGGMLVSSVFKPSQAGLPNLGQMEAFDTSPTYSWNAQGNPLAEGTILPVLYGKFLVTPPLIARNVESSGTNQHLNLLYAVAGHKIDAVEKIYLNDQTTDYYKETVIDIRYGDADQTFIPFFNDLKEELSIQTKLSTDWTQRELPGTVQGFAVGIGYRIYYANDSGGLSPVSADVYIEYRQKGHTSWTRFRTMNTRPVTITTYRWSAGYGGWNGRWYEVQAGSSNYADHQEGEIHQSATWESYYDSESGGYYNVQTRPATSWAWRGYTTNYAAGGVEVDFLSLTSSDSNQLTYVLYRDYLPEGSYEVRMRLVSPLIEDSRHGSDVFWNYALMIQYDDFTYPCTALVGIRALGTDQISGGQPVVKILARRDYVWVYDAINKKYTQQSARNPAWASYDALHNGAPGHPDPAIYGLSVPYDRIVYADFLDWATWCDQKKYTVDIYVEAAMNGKAALDMIGLMGRGITVQIGSKFTCMVDKPRDLPRQTFLIGLGNIASGTFTKTWLPLQDRANAIELTYFDAEMQYQRQVVEIYQDGFDTSSRAINKTQRTLYGCTSRQDALTFGRALMLRNRYLTYMPSLEVGIESIHCLPGDPVDVAFDVLQGGASGRIISADSGSIVIDILVTLLPAVQYAMELQHIDNDDREYVYIVGVSGETETDTLTLLKPPVKIPQAGSKYAFGEVGRTKKMFTIVDMQTASDQKKRLQLLEYVPELYDDQAYVPDDEDWSMTAFIRNLRLTEIWQPGGPDGSGRSVIGVSWRGNAVLWSVYIREYGGAHYWTKDADVVVPERRIERGLIIGHTYEVSVSISGPERGVTDTITLRGKIAPPNDVRNFRLTIYDDELRMTWDHIPDADLWGYQIRAGATWETSLIVLDGVQENSAAWEPPMDGTYRLWIKAIDDSGIYSVNAATDQATIDISKELNVIWKREELPDYVNDATLERLVAMDERKKVAWIPSLTDTDFPVWYTDSDIGYYCGDTAPGIYTSQVYDLGVVTPFTFRMTAEFTAILVGATDLTYPARSDLTYPADTDISITSLSVYASDFRISYDSETWSNWKPWTSVQDVTARFLQFRVSTVLDSVGVKFTFTRIAALADVPEQFIIYTSSIDEEGTTFTMEGLGLRPMIMEYHVGVTIIGTAAFFPAVEKDDQEFTVRCFDVLGDTHAAETSIEVRGF